MAFGLGKLQGLEAKLDIYESLSKEMLDKLERAVSSIQDSNQKVAIILERHENRLDESTKSDNLIIKMIEEMKDVNEKDREVIHDRISKIQIKVDHNQKFVIGVTAVLTTLVTVLNLLPGLLDTLTPAKQSSIIERPIVSRIV